jgi:MtN3 and saliva related transmembrane protein
MERHELTQLVGTLAATLTTLAFVPQVLRAWRTKSVADLSIGMLVAFTTGVALWTVYGIALGELPIIIANAVTFVLALILLSLKLRY